jgi:hypothetical protein
MASSTIMATNQQTTTPQLEALRKGQAKKRSSVDPSHILDKAIYQLWETINDLDQIQPERVEHYRVSVFGSSRYPQEGQTFVSPFPGDGEMRNN